MIRPSTCLALLSSMATLTFGAPLPSAQAITNNPTDVVLRADFPQGNAQTVVGVIQFYSLNGTTKVHVDVTGLPKNSGMFAYHIHERPVGADKSCAGTGTHFNPFGASSECEALGDDSLCEVGDLSGKHGLINTTCFELFYHDPYLSLDPSSQQYIGNKAINIHLENGDRLACATIKPSREPEDLLLLNAETEAEEVRKFEELAGISHAVPHVPLHATAVDFDGQHFSDVPQTLSKGGPAESNDALDLDSEASEDIGEPVDLSIDADTEDSDIHSDMDLDTLLSDHVDNTESVDFTPEDFESNSDTNNTTAISNNTNDTNTSQSTDEEEENRATALNSGVALSVMAAIVFGFLW